MQNEIEKFILFLKFELRLSTNTVASYKTDLKKYISFLSNNKNVLSLNSINYNDIREYISYLSKNKNKPSSINRNISSIKKFHLYLFDNNIADNNPSELLESQKNRRNFPNTLSVMEIEQIFESIDTISSIGLSRWPTKDVLSVAPKAVIDALITGLAREEGRNGIRANSVQLGIIEAGIFLRIKDTEYDERYIEAAKNNTALKRLGSAEDVSDAVIFLSSNRANYITGQTIYLDGGFRI